MMLAVASIVFSYLYKLLKLPLCLMYGIFKLLVYIGMVPQLFWCSGMALATGGICIRVIALCVLLVIVRETSIESQRLQTELSALG